MLMKDLEVEGRRSVLTIPGSLMPSIQLGKNLQSLATSQFDDMDMQPALSIHISMSSGARLGPGDYWTICMPSIWRVRVAYYSSDG
jgi:hypothetical protein